MNFTDKVISKHLDIVLLRTYDDGSKSIVKLIEKSKHRKGQEYRITKALQAANIRVPKVQGYHEIDLTYKDNTYTEMMIIEYIPGSTTLERSYPKEEAKRIALQMLDLVEKMHKTGYYHGDLHLGNFIWNGKELTLIDFGCSYNIEFWQKINKKTFIGTSQHAKSLCQEIPQKFMLSGIEYDWEFYSHHEENLLNNCISLLLAIECKNKSIEELRHVVNSL
nr:serine/threonine kinase [Cedratvirus plubellavi]